MLERDYSITLKLPKPFGKRACQTSSMTNELRSAVERLAMSLRSFFAALETLAKRHGILHG